MKKRKGEGVKEPVSYLTISANVDADVLAFFGPTVKHRYFNPDAMVDVVDGVYERLLA